ncbi:hypothetical protein PENSUB_5472 [Penicillium subrubescens]|uniref:Uncharacterized protein n=1 Tax=Penicillium subrubescens TaxID=1316194 RepID=A0A1Q5UQX6_9EURO|nr:hypothetical protein PENSUB_5472 [Penicillium subrubescens]
MGRLPWSRDTTQIEYPGSPRHERSLAVVLDGTWLDATDTLHAQGYYLERRLEPSTLHSHSSNVREKSTVVTQ